jgi:23S rRNA-/tRNA-specific pseudouridylate synthase
MDKDFPIIYQSEAVYVINKPVGVISTKISNLICHRLDRDTSGLLIVAKSEKYKNQIQKQFKVRRIKKIYLAVVLGKFSDKQIVEGWLERDPKDKRLMRISPGFVKSGDEFSQPEQQGSNKRYSKTIICPINVVEKNIFKANRAQFNYLSLVEAELITGRKHQIRTHLNYLGHPIIGDNWYQTKVSRDANKKLEAKRLMLDAHRLKFFDPAVKRLVDLKSKTPPEFSDLLI